MASRLLRRLLFTPPFGPWAAAVVVGVSVASLAAVAATRAPLKTRTAEPQATPATDPFYANPHIDVDEWRDTPVRRAIHSVRCCWGRCSSRPPPGR